MTQSRIIFLFRYLTYRDAKCAVFRDDRPALDEDGSFLWVFGDFPFDIFNCAPDLSGKNPQCLKGVRIGSTCHENAGFAVGAVVEFDIAACGDIRDSNVVRDAADKPVSLHSKERDPVFMEDLKRWMRGRAKDWRDDVMLVGIIERVDDIKNLSVSARKHLEGDEHLADPFARCSNTVARGVEIRLVIADGKLRVPILFASVPSHKLPHGVVESAGEVVDCIADYDREAVGDTLDKAYLDYWLSRLLIVLDAKSVRLPLYEGFELPFKVSNVMLRSVEF